MSAIRSMVIVEDDPDVVQFLQAALAGWDGPLKMSICTNGQEAIATIIREQPDLVMLDLMLPRISGFEVFRQIKTRCPGKRPKVLIITAYHADGTEAAIESLGADGFIAKPFTLEELYDQLRPFLETR
ncbi:MAG: response regulator transcription factor [Elusimicrobia bacterium]|nr:response regulator transcription factor [Elusimicrobiota bacterium]